jgi:tripartite-type tricarboxylate transporter receptor subunit TctC
MKTIAARFILGTVFSAALAGAVNAQTYPTRPITVIIPFAGGSASDVVSRIMLDKMSKSMGQPIVVENRPGAGGNSGTAAAARAKPDGYTLVGAGSGPIAANITLYKNLGYDPQKELEIIAPFAGFTIVVVASNALKVNSLKELVAHIKANPGKLNYGSVGIGSSQHLAGEYFAQVTGTKITHVPYRNIAQYGPDLIAGAVPLGFQWYPNVAAPLQKGAKALAVAGDQRLAALPNTPTTAEAGLPEYKVAGWFALAAPAGTPRPILERLNKELTAALKDPAVRKGFEKAGAAPIALSLDAAKKFHAEQIVLYRNIITKAGIKQIQ